MNINNLKLSLNSSIEKALGIIGKERVGLSVMVGKNGEFLGIILDSNIREALIDGKILKSKIKEIYTKNPIIITENISKTKFLELSAKTDICDFPVLNKEGEVVSIRSISSLLSTKKLPFYVILMAGGFESCLKELTRETPKPMLKVGKGPILENTIQRLHTQGFEKFIFCINYKRQIIEDYFKKGEESDIKISYIKRRKKLGTTGALGLIRQKMEQGSVVMNAGILTELDLNELLKAHQKSGALMSVCARGFHRQVPYGVIKQRNGFITYIEEKSTQSSSVSAGIYVCGPQILELLKKNTYLDMSELIEKVMQKGRVNTFLIENYWIDIGRLEEFKRANDGIKE